MVVLENEDPDPDFQIKLSFNIFFTLIIEFQVKESVE